MTPDTFVSRVHHLRGSWQERRQVKGLATAHDFDSQFELLRTFHRWAQEAVSDIRSVYGQALDLFLSPEPGKEGQPAFSVVLGGMFSITFALVQRTRSGTNGWFVAVSEALSGPGGRISAAGPERRNGQWSRSRVDNLMLSLLGAYERWQSESESPSAFERRPGPRGVRKGA
jgi:hypothetical protein